MSFQMSSRMLDVFTSTNNKFTLKFSRTGLRSFMESPNENRYSKKQPYQINVDKLLNLKNWTLSPTTLNFYLLDILHYQNKPNFERYSALQKKPKKSVTVSKILNVRPKNIYKKCKTLHCHSTFM